jgi:hypothetical protein
MTIDDIPAIHRGTPAFRRANLALFEGHRGLRHDCWHMQVHGRRRISPMPGHGKLVACIDPPKPRKRFIRSCLMRYRP